jgi:outer membrane lipoprotein SlyB
VFGRLNTGGGVLGGFGGAAVGRGVPRLMKVGVPWAT